jgi:transcriptional regulator with XRE-family HTH domain
MICAGKTLSWQERSSTTQNFRLRAALTKAGMLPDDLADRVEVDAKTVGRWLSGRVPHPRHRALVAQTLASDELELWPEAKPTNAAEDPFKELAGAWPDATDTRAPDWMTMLDAATEQIDLLDLTLGGIVTERGVIEQLAAKTARGTRLRILIGATDSAHLTALDQELHPEPRPDDREDWSASEHERDQAIEALRPLIIQPGVEIREFVAARPNTILRLDEQMLVTVQLYGLARPDAPILHLRRRQDQGIFDQLAGHFQRLWKQSEQIELDTDPDDLLEDPQRSQQSGTGTDASPTPQQAQQALDRLRAGVS